MEASAPRLVDPAAIGKPRDYDHLLGTMKDLHLSQQVGTSRHAIKRRREAYGVAPYTVAQAIAPYAHLLGVVSDRYVATRCGVSPHMVKAFRESQGILREFKPKPRVQRLPTGHPLRPYKALFGLVSDQEISRVSKVSVDGVAEARESFGYGPVAPSLQPSEVVPLNDVHGPWLGYESLLHCMSIAKISRLTGVPYSVIEKRRDFLGVKPYERVSRIARYDHLLGVIPNALLAQLAGLSTARVQELSRAKKIAN
uniref:hypothetical protein n=1 Tax=Pseudomonas syringae TaxID=317 RepID=UPI001E3D7992|nr:hypothetical protein [Pseudomonas syringae]QOU99745.1 hypothetical protein [Pseudomonas syringae pv. actinidiae]